MKLHVRETKQPGFLKQLICAAVWSDDAERHPRFWVIGTNSQGAVVLKIAADHKDEAWEKCDRITSELKTMDAREFASRYGVDVADVLE